MDGVLEPADAEKIEEKIQESEFALGIVNRVRDVVRQLRLGAPKLRGKEMGLDPNTVAEYLDNTLPAEQVPDFEKVCLESDKHLAEVAACHQVLALVLGEPAEVSPESRGRMYALPQAKEPKPEMAKEATTAEISGNGSPVAVEEPPHDEDGGRPQRQKPEIPEYLRETSGRRMWPVAAAVLMLIMLLCVTVLAIGPRNLMAIFRGEKSPEAVSLNKVTPPVESTADMKSERGEEGLTPLDDTEPETASATATDEVVEDKEQPEVPRKGEVTAEPPVPGTMPEVSDHDIKVLPEPELSPVDDEQPEVPEPPAVVDDEEMAEPPERPSAVGPVRPGNKSPSLLARLVSERTVLLRFVADSSTWERLPARSAIGPGDRLLAMPAFDATLALGSGINLLLQGGTLVEFGPPGADGTPQLTILYGRVVLMTAGGNQTGIHLVADGQQGWLGLTGQDSIAAVEAERVLSPGSDPEAEPAPLVVRLCVGQGAVAWRTSEDARSRTLTAPVQYTLGSDKEIAEEQSPAWLTQNTTPSIEQRGAELIEVELAKDRDITIQTALKELVEHRRSEVKALAARCLAHLGVYDPIIKALGNPPQHAAWPALTNELAQAIARSPREATDVRKAFERERGDVGTKLFRLLGGYSTQQLRDGAAVELVEGLDNEEVDIRVLSFWNLHRITGEMNAYRADHVAARRKAAMQKWREQLEAGDIVSWDEDNDGNSKEGEANDSDP